MDDINQQVQIRQSPPLGAYLLPDGGCHFCVWAPTADMIELILLTPEERTIPLEANGQGYYQCFVPQVSAGSLYRYRINNELEIADPASRFQPDGVHGPSQVMDSHFDWTKTDWHNLPLRDYIFYELHVGTFTEEGTFEAIIPHLDELQQLGINAIELMPVAQFPGGRNWGYDGVLPYAVQNTYGGPAGLKTLVDACHQREMAVVLDVVYNHLGPEGNYLSLFGPYFTDRYISPWGSSINFDGEYSDEVKRFFIENAIYWLDEFHIDALRLDATHAIFDNSAVPFLEELVAVTQHWADIHNRRIYLIAENDRSDVKTVQSPDIGGVGMDAQWLDDLHHCLHVHFTGQKDGYYTDYTDSFHQLVKCLDEGFVFSGDYSPFRKRRHGTSSSGIPGHRFVVSAQNHDQVGNRMLGERLGLLTDPEGLKLAAGIVLLSPYLPLIFMGEEYGETAPFLFFTSFYDPDLVEAVRQGRAREFASFAWQGEPPDPQAESTFLQCKLNRELRHQDQGQHREIYELYKTLIQLRKTIPALHNPDKNDLDIWWQDQVITLHRWSEDRWAEGKWAASSAIFAVFNLHLDTPATLSIHFPPGTWKKLFASTDDESATSVFDTQTAPQINLPPKSFVLYIRA